MSEESSNPTMTLGDIRPGMKFDRVMKCEVVRKVEPGEIYNGMTLFNERGTLFWCRNPHSKVEELVCFDHFFKAKFESGEHDAALLSIKRPVGE